MRKGIGIVDMEYGRVAGEEQNSITLFRGIPYAKPPVGELRWKAPQPAEPWEGVRECRRFRDMCIQNPGWVGMDAFEHHSQSEDCLYLNIWTPAASAEEELPVLFWIHGGGFQGGLGDEELYHGWSLAAKGVLVVSINYRLGALGFLAHPELSRESEHGVSGNYGLLDQIAALRWVKKNIRGFGGDPNRIVLDGQSAGGMSVGALISSPLTSGLYSAAIIQSGGPTAGRAVTLSQGEQIGVELLEKLSCRNLRELRSLPVEQVLKASCPEPGDPLQYQPFVDGYVLREDPYEAISAGRIGQVPLIIGGNADEGLFAPFGGKEYVDFLASVRAIFGENTEDFLKLYKVTEENFQRACLDAQRDYGFLNIQRVLSRLSKVHPCPVYQYYFVEPIVLGDGTFVGATHSAELFYVFHTLSVMGGSTPEGKPMKPRLSQAQYALSDAMGSYWSNFAKHGNPNGPGLPDWEPLSSTAPQYLRLEAEGIQTEATRFPEKLELLKSKL